MAVTAYQFPTANSNGGSGFNFITPNNMHADDGVVTTKNSGQTTVDVDFSTFGFTPLIPDGATIDGIEAEMECRDNFGDAGWFLNLSLSWNAETTFTAVKRVPAAGDYTAGSGTAFVIRTAGGATDKWGRTWTKDEFSDTNLRLRFEYSGETFAEFEGDYVKVRVHYTESGVSGTIGVTLTAFAPSMAGTTTIVGSMANALSVFAPSMAGTTTITGTLISTLSNFVSAIQGTTTLQGAMASALSDFVSAFQGTTTIVGSMANTLAAFVGNFVEAITTFAGACGVSLPVFFLFNRRG